ncbi:MAG: hypothetical protein IJD75_05090, partial [Clostridia bacterium]|nr:hypothetical protein [Clostridia bacterium]
MYDKDLTRRICDLSCTKNDIAVNQTTVKYDTEQPFIKYYSLSTLRGAIEKYLFKEWDDTTLAGWACLYCWILSGGFDDNLKEDLNSFESFFKDLLTWDLDGLSFFSEEYWDEEMLSISKKTELYENYD